MIRNYDTYGRAPSKVTAGESMVAIEHPSGSIRVASVVHAEQDAEDRVIYAMLDRVVHDRHTRYTGWRMAGCFATEMYKERDERRSSEAIEGIRDTVDDVLGRAWPGAVIDGAAHDIAQYIEDQDRIVGSWGRPSAIAGAVAWCVQRLDECDLDVSVDREAVARAVLDECRRVLEVDSVTSL